ncbi:MAG TPA: hypothetical protein VNZ53_22810 [Steroidobacteraceae bacterium]|jgi:hypothetical protein|nr:hypothetical protein [Steroidobacteraceae bacterium]
MTAIKLLSAGLIATVMFSAPGMACKRHVAKKANARAFPIARYFYSYARIPAPRVDQLAAPRPARICDVGDNPFIC